MGSNYFGIPSMGNNERLSSSTSSSRRNKKGGGGGSDKPKQPQRGLGVAQLEQIRLRTQMSCGLNNSPLIQEDMIGVQGVPPYGIAPQSSTSYPNYSQSSPTTSSTYGHHPNFMLAFGEENVRFQDSQTTTTLRWNPNSTGVIDNSTFRNQSAFPSHQLPYFEDPRKGRMDLMRSSSQNSESSDHEDVDLELRLSI